jgi:hypothetical protein
MKGLRITTDGEVSLVPCDSLEALQASVGGYVESPSILRDELSHLTMWCNEEARIFNLPPNVVAAYVLGWPGRGPFALLGDVLITGPVGRSGDTKGLVDDDIAMVMNIVRHMLPTASVRQVV